MNKEQMKLLRDDGKTLREIAEASGQSIKTVFYATGGRRGPERKHGKNNVERDEKIRRFAAEGFKQIELATLYEISQARISQIIKDGG